MFEMKFGSTESTNALTKTEVTENLAIDTNKNSQGKLPVNNSEPSITKQRFSCLAGTLIIFVVIIAVSLYLYQKKVS